MHRTLVSQCILIHQMEATHFSRASGSGTACILYSGKPPVHITAQFLVSVEKHYMCQRLGWRAASAFRGRYGGGGQGVNVLEFHAQCVAPLHPPPPHFPCPFSNPWPTTPNTDHWPGSALPRGPLSNIQMSRVISGGVISARGRRRGSGVALLRRLPSPRPCPPHLLAGANDCMKTGVGMDAVFNIHHGPQAPRAKAGGQSPLKCHPAWKG